jgi:transposase-like protein
MTQISCTYEELIRKVTSNVKSTWDFIINENLINVEPKCCQKEMKEEEIKDERIQMPIQWRCRKCRSTKSLLLDSIFEETKLELGIFIKIIYHYALGYPQQQCSLQTKVSIKTINRLYIKFREIVCMEIIKQQQTHKIGGKGKIIEADEAKFGKNKNNQGVERDGIWVIAAICRETLDFTLEIVETRDEKACIGFCTRNIHKGSHIFTDCWASYNKLSENGFIHSSVNHKEQFVTLNGIHTNTMEGWWKHLKDYVGNVRKENKGFYFLEFIWRKQLERRNLCPFQSFLKLCQFE